MNSYPLITPLVGVSGSRGSDPQTRGGTGKKKAKRHRGEPGHTRDTRIHRRYHYSTNLQLNCTEQRPFL